MQLRKTLLTCVPSRRASLGIGLFLLCSMFATDGCLSRSLTGIYIEPSGGACVYPGFTVQFQAYGTFTESGHATVTRNITNQASWKIDLPNLASVNSAGLVTTTGLAIGITNVIATAQGEFGIVRSSAPLTVEKTCVSGAVARTMSSLRILPGDQSFVVGDTTQLLVVGHFTSEPLSEDVTRQVVFESSNPQVARVTAAGLVTATGEGQAIITAKQSMPDGMIVTSAQNVQVESGPAPQ
jgi:hypothetical protein